MILLFREYRDEGHVSPLLAKRGTERAAVTPAVVLPAAEEDVFGLFDDLLQQPLTLLQAANFCLVIGQGARQAQALVSKGGARRVGHHHRAQLLLVKLQEKQGF